jgi:hypothetical protein
MSSTIELNKDLLQKIRELRRKGPAGWRLLNPLLTRILTALNITVSVDGGDVQVIKNGKGFHLRITAGAADPHPWKVLSGSASNKRRITPGTLGSIMPWIGLTRLDAEPAPEVTIVEGVANYIYLRIQLALTTELLFITGATLAEGDLTVLASLNGDPADLDDPGAGLFHEHLATISASGNATPIRTTSLTWSVSDTGTSTSTAQINVGI